MKRVGFVLLLIGLLSIPGYSCAEIPAPAGVTASEGTYSNKIFVTWDDVPSASAVNYEVWRDSYESCVGAVPCEPEFILWGHSILDQTIFIDGGEDILPFGQIFQYRIKACSYDETVKEYSCSDFSMPAYGFILEDAPIAKLPSPTGVTATEGTWENYVKVSWDKVSGATTYEVWRDSYESCEGAIPCEPEFILWRVFGGNVYGYFEARDVVLPYGQVFEYRIKACDNDEIANEYICSDFSLPAYGYISEDAPTMVSDTAKFSAPEYYTPSPWGPNGGGGGGIFGDIIKSRVTGYHLDGFTANGVQVYMPVTPGFKALKGAQEYVRSFAPNLARSVRGFFDYLEQKADSNEGGLLYNLGTHVFPILGKIAEKSLAFIGEQKFIDTAYSDTTISIEKFNELEGKGLAIAPKVVKEMEYNKQEKKLSDIVLVY